MLDSYATVADNYDIMIDWSARMAHERPFFERFFQEAQVWRVLDIGSATGHHSRMFAELGAKVIGLEPSQAMLMKARELTPGVNPHFVEGDFGHVPQLKRQFDLITVLGNTLAHVKDADELQQAVQAMHNALSPNGHLCIQVINYDCLLAVGSQWLPLISRQVDGKEYLFLREHRLQGVSAEFTMITLINNEVWQQQVERSSHLALTSDVLKLALKQAGFKKISLYGDYARKSFDPGKSSSLIVVARQ